MAKRELGPAALEVAQAVANAWPGGEVVVGVSGGADSLALALGAKWCAEKRGGTVRAVIVDHQLQQNSGDIADHVRGTLEVRGIHAEVRKVDVEPSVEGVEAAARDSRLDALAQDGLPVLLGHTLDDQAEQVFLGLIRGSGIRSLAGMAPARGPFIRPLLAVRRSTTEQACVEWDIRYWSDPMNLDDAFTRVRVRKWLGDFEGVVGRDIIPSLGRSAELARADADLLDELARGAVGILDGPLQVAAVKDLPDALRWRVLKNWLTRGGAVVGMGHVLAVDALVSAWHGQGPIDVPCARVQRTDGELRLLG